MNKEFVIVIEVDNKRAAAAYNKGLADLELVWPQLMEFSKREDTKHQIKYNADLLEFQNQQKIYKEKVDNYHKAALSY